MKSSAKKILSVILLILLGVAGRIFFVEVIKVPNLEIVTELSLLAGFSLGGVFSFLAPLAVISLSDWFIGNNAILLFTWSAFGLIGLFGVLLGKPPHYNGDKTALDGFNGRSSSSVWCGGKQNKFSFPLVFKATGFGVLAACFFFLYTNFGWWVLSGMYPHTWWGLLTCYVNGLPFFKTNLLGDLRFTPLVFSAFFAIIFLSKRIKLRLQFRSGRSHVVIN